MTEATKAGSTKRKYAASEVDLVTVGRELHVNKIVTGDNLKMNDQLQVNVEVAEAGNNRVLWHETVKTPAVDMIHTRAEIMEKIWLSLFPRLGISAISDRPTFPHQEIAYASYLRSLASFAIECAKMPPTPRKRSQTKSPALPSKAFVLLGAES